MRPAATILKQQHKHNGNGSRCPFFTPQNSTGAGSQVNASSFAIYRKCQHCDEEEKRLQRKEGKYNSIETSGETGKYLPLTNNSGQELPSKDKCFFEQRLGYDFSQVRLHTGVEAERSAESINALAYTQGSNIMFAKGQFNMSTPQGIHLLAHELTNAVQLAGGNTPAIQRKTKPAPEPQFVHDAKENLADLKKRRSIKLTGSTYYPEDVRTAEKYVQFTQAVAADSTADIPKLLKELMATDMNALAPDAPSIEDLAAITAKLMRLGMDKEAAQVQQFGINYTAQQEGSNDPFVYKMYMLSFMLDGLPKAADMHDAVAASSALDVWVKYMQQLVTQAISIQPGIQGKIAPSGDERHGVKTVFDFIDSLRQDFSAAFVQFNMLYQQLLDSAIIDLENGKGNAQLETAKAKLEMLKALKPPDGLLESEADVTKTIITGRSGIFKAGKHIDYFRKGKDALAHSEDIELYDPKAEANPPEKAMSAKRMFEIRDKQINALEQLYGFKKDEHGSITAEAKENAAAIKSAGLLHLHNDNDWRKFLLEKYKLHKAANNNDKSKAFDATISTIKMYMNAFTLHTPHNIIESKSVNQLNIKFPEALTGQLIHDCGVYALRIVYMLSLIKDDPDLALDIKFIKLPLHTGLIITGKGLPTYITHNDMITPVEAAEVAKRRTAWNKETAKMGGDEKDNNQFMAELAAEEFIPGAEMPYRLETVPHVKDSKRYAAELWGFYMEHVVPDVFSPSVVNPSDKNFRAHLMYLDVLEAYKGFYNTSYLTFWNGTVVKEWKARKHQLQNTTGTTFDSLFEAYKKPVEAAFKTANTNFDMIRARLKEIKDTVLANPGIIAKNTKLTDADRMVKVAGDWMELQGDMATDPDVHKNNDRRDNEVEPLD